MMAKIILPNIKKMPKSLQVALRKLAIKNGIKFNEIVGIDFPIDENDFVIKQMKYNNSYVGYVKWTHVTCDDFVNAFK